MRRAVAAAFLALAARPAAADVSLVQVVQAEAGDPDSPREADPPNNPIEGRHGGAPPRQRRHGGAPEESAGLLAKSLVEVSRGRMRLVTAVARKAGAREEAPWRLVQVLDLATTSLLVIDPDARTWERRPLTAVIDGPAPGARPGGFELLSSSIAIVPGALVRRCLGADCSHFHATIRLVLRGRGGARRKARLEQDIWMAPLTGEAQKGLLDLIAFEAAYRRQAGTELSPIDRQTYRVREAAEQLGVPRGQLESVVAGVRRALTEVPGYPLTSSVSWWLEGGRLPGRKRAPELPSKTEPRLLQDPPPRLPPPPRRLFVRIDWHGGWKRLDRALAQAAFGLPRRGPPAPPERPAGPQAMLRDYERFQAELAAVVEALDRGQAAQPRAPDELPREGGDLTAPPPGPPEAVRAGGTTGSSRLYESFSEIGELLSINGIPDDHFSPPPGFRKK